MEIQEFSARHLVAQLVFEQTQGAVLDERGAIARAMTQGLGNDQVKIHATAVEVTSPDERDEFRIGIQQLYVSILAFDDFSEAKERARAFFELGISHLNTPPISRARVHTSDIAPAETFEELRDAFAGSLCDRDKSLRQAIGIDLSDIGFSFDFDDSNTSAAVSFGPIRSEELQSYLDDDAGDYPPTSLLLDINARLKAKGKPVTTDALDFFDKACDRNRTIMSRVALWLKEAL